MEKIRTLDRRDMKMESRRNGSNDLTIWRVLGGIALIGLAAVLITTLPDIKRYIRISTM